jgi:uncharacterized protein YkwD
MKLNTTRRRTLTATTLIVTALSATTTAAAAVPAAAPGAARASCTPGAELNELQLSKPSTKVRGWKVLEREVTPKGAGKTRGRVRVQGTAKTRAHYRAVGTVQRCDGAGPKKVTLDETAATSRLTAATANEVRKSSRQAVSAAKSAAKDKVRARGTKAGKKAVKTAAREDAKSRLLAKAGVAPVGATPDVSALAAKILALVNAERGKVSLAPLKYLPQFVPSSTAWADVLVDGPFDHDPNLKAAGDALGCNKRPGGFANAFLEAIAKGDFSVAGTSTPSVDAFAQTVVDAWMASSTHKPILLSNATSYVGIGSVYRSKVWTVVYRSAAADCSNITGY